MQICRKMSDDRSEQSYFREHEEEGARMVFSFAVVPGGAILGYGVGIAVNQSVSFAIAGLGLGVMLWGLIMSVRRTK